MLKGKAFTLIELLIVIAIIGILASIVLVSLSQSRNKANISDVQRFGKQLTDTFQACDADSGDIAPPNSATAPTNDICLVPGGAIWPSPLPQGMVYSTVYTGGEDNLILMQNTSTNTQLWCGHRVAWSSYCGTDPALCELSSRYSCVLRSPTLYGDTNFHLLF